MKHAFLLMIHNNYDLVGRLLKKLDNPDNDIYIHVDKKSKFNEFDKKKLCTNCNKSNLYFVERYNVTWGGYSQINCQLRILEAAIKKNYDYYHYISGVDFPIKTMKYIHDFFEKYKGCEFIGIYPDEFIKKFSYRYSVYHLFRERCGRKKGLLLFFEKCLIVFQRIIRVNRSKKYPNLIFKGGANWCSISHNFSLYLLQNERLISEVFKYSLCCDEIFIQTIAYNSVFKDKIYQYKYCVDVHDSYLRCVDWSRTGKSKGSPYTYNIDDYILLVNSPNIFARKVSDSSDKEELLLKSLEKL